MLLDALRTRLAWDPDTRERHLVVARLVGQPRTVVDVGGVPGQLSRLLRPAPVVAANIEPPADLLVEPDGLPFRDRSIDTVTSLDALEHVPPDARAPWIAELVRIAARRLVLCCPLGSPEHAAAEADLQAWLREVTGEEDRWLGEHVGHGLPEREAVESAFAAALAPDDRISYAFHGDVRRTVAMVRTMVLAHRRPGLRTLARYAAARARHKPDGTLHDAPSPHTNRIFVVVDRAG